nr:hypothetical protein [Tanacetum cinerariifolium]
MICLTTASLFLCINGEIHSFFKSSRGLRQGDLISPYLFTLVMKVLNLMIKRKIGNDKRFKFHSGCKALGLTHFCFADDLLLLCHGGLIFTCVLRRGLDEFSMFYGLYSSMEKSTSYLCNVPNDIKVQISLGMPFKESILPVRYLGVHMMTRKLRNDDCRVLIDNVKKKIFDWKNKYLSYGGKLQLIASVLSLLNVYWASMFILPKNICASIDRILKDFLWSFEENRKGFTSVAWKDICVPKSQGGLGLRSMKLMNEGLMIKYLWNIVSKKDSLSVKRVNSYRLKGKCVWTLSVSDNTVWCWRHILKLKNKLVTHNLLHTRGIGVNDKTVDRIRNNLWTWPSDWNRSFKDVLDVLILILNEFEDKAIWFNKKIEEVNFSGERSLQCFKD